LLLFFSNSFYIPMEILWDITYQSWLDLPNPSLKIYDWSGFLIKEISLTDKNKYGSNNAFDITGKVLLNPFSGELKFKIVSNWKIYDTQITVDTWYGCKKKASFSTMKNL